MLEDVFYFEILFSGQPAKKNLCYAVDQHAITMVSNIGIEELVVNPPNPKNIKRMILDIRLGPQFVINNSKLIKQASGLINEVDWILRTGQRREIV